MSRVYKTPALKPEQNKVNTGAAYPQSDFSQEFHDVFGTLNTKDGDSPVSHVLGGLFSNPSKLDARYAKQTGRESANEGEGGGTNITNMGTWTGTAVSYYSAASYEEYNYPVLDSNNNPIQTTYRGVWTRIYPMAPSVSLLTSAGLFVPPTNSGTSITAGSNVIDVLSVKISNIPPGKQYLFLTLGTYSASINTKFESFFPPTRPPIYYKGGGSASSPAFFAGTLWAPVENGNLWSATTKIAIPASFGKDGLGQSVITSTSLQSSFTMKDTYNPSSVNDYRDQKYNFQKYTFEHVNSLSQLANMDLTQSTAYNAEKYASIADNPLLHAEAYIHTDSSGNKCLAISNPTVYTLDGTVTVVGS